MMQSHTALTLHTTHHSPLEAFRYSFVLGHQQSMTKHGHFTSVATQTVIARMYIIINSSNSGREYASSLQNTWPYSVTLTVSGPCVGVKPHDKSHARFQMPTTLRLRAGSDSPTADSSCSGCIDSHCIRRRGVLPIHGCNVRG